MTSRDRRPLRFGRLIWAVLLVVVFAWWWGALCVLLALSAALLGCVGQALLWCSRHGMTLLRAVVMLETFDEAEEVLSHARG